MKQHYTWWGDVIKPLLSAIFGAFVQGVALTAGAIVVLRIAGVLL